MIARQDDSWGLTCPLPEIQNTLPDSVRGMVERKIGRLDADCAQFRRLQAFRAPNSIRQCCRASRESMRRRLKPHWKFWRQSHRLVRFEREEEFPDGTFSLRYAFSHALYQNALFASIRPTQRAAMSDKVAEALLACHGSGAGVASQLGHLFETARNWERASEFFAAASENVARLSANREAADFALRAIANAEKIQGGARARRVLQGTLQLAGARQALSEYEQSISGFLSAAGFAETLGDTETQVNALCGAAISAGFLRQADRQHELATMALRLARSTGSSGAYAESVLGGKHIFSGDLTVAASAWRAPCLLYSRAGPLMPPYLQAVISAFCSIFSRSTARRKPCWTGR